uniref:AMP-binding domain-containing protein n=1 Tax=Panagrellus redivivus TaxID=6233 RepID=A0A7E4W0G1_PANRE
MPLQVRKESVFCLDFTRLQDNDFNPYDVTVPEIVYKKCASNRIAFAFDSEKAGLTFGAVQSDMESFAAGLLATGLQAGDRILIAGYNVSQVVVTALGAARAGLVFGLANPNFSSSDQLQHLLLAGNFKAVILFAPGKDVDAPHKLMLQIAPELTNSPKGKLSTESLPSLTHVILADEDHKHAGTWTLSEIYGKATKIKIEKLPDYKQWNPHKLAAIGFTLGSTGLPKAFGLSHYQLVNGARLAAMAIGIDDSTVLCCALPLFRLPVFALVAFTPFLLESKSVFSEPSPIPRNLFACIKKYQATTVLSNAAALRLGLRLFFTHKVLLPSVSTVILLGERVNAELLLSVDRVMPNASRIAVGMLLTEAGGIPILSDNTTNLVKYVGKPLDAYPIELIPVEKLTRKRADIGELRLHPLMNTKFMGQGPEFKEYSDFIDTGDVVIHTPEGNIEILCHKDDIIYDRHDNLVEHWRLEKAMAAYEGIKGIQVLQVCPGAPVVAVIVPRNFECVPEFIKNDLCQLCRNADVSLPDKVAVVDDFPRVNTKIQKFKLRQILNANLLTLY